MRRTFLLLLLLAAPLPPRAAAAQVSDRAIWLGGTAAVAGALLLDRTVDDVVPQGGGERLAGFTRVLNYGGRPQIAMAALGGGWVVGRLAGQPQLERTAVRVGGGLLAAGVVNGVLKYGLGRERPSLTDDPHRLRPFNPDNAWQAFPSGHATVAFSLATSLAAEARRPWVTAAAYTGASLVAWSRVYDDKHWTSDVVGGAVIGVGVTRAALRAVRRAQGTPGAVDVVPIPGGVALRLPIR